MGSRSDWETMREADEVLTQFGVPHECHVSAYRSCTDGVASTAVARSWKSSSPAPEARLSPRHGGGRCCRSSACPCRARPQRSRFAARSRCRRHSRGDCAIGAAGAGNARLLAVSTRHQPPRSSRSCRPTARISDAVQRDQLTWRTYHSRITIVLGGALGHVRDGGPQAGYRPHLRAWARHAHGPRLRRRGRRLL